jgi:hypothetical protein
MIIHLGPNLSVIHPATGDRNPRSKLPILGATDVVARLKLSSEAMGLKNAENEKLTKPQPTKVIIPVARTVHQPKNTSGNFLRLIMATSV